MILSHSLALSSLTLTDRLIEVIHSESKLFLVFEYLDQDLKKYMDTRGPLPLPEVKVKHQE